MLPASSFPGPLPLSPSAVLNLLERLEEFDQPGGAFLSFLMVPIEPRIGEWRFAGASGSLAEAIRQVGRFAASRWPGSPDGPSIVRTLVGRLPDAKDDLLDYEDSLQEESGGFPMQVPKEVLGPHRVVLDVEMSAPHDDTGVFVVEVPAPTGAPVGAAFESSAVAGWRQATLAWVHEAGTSQFGPPAPEAWAALQRESRPEDWTRWGEHWEEFQGWEDVIHPGEPGQPDD